MANLKKKINSLYERSSLQSNPSTPFGIQVSLRGRGGLRAGYLNKLNRQRKKTGGQLKGLPGCGEQVKDWLLGY
jgi:hypothetical protein